MSSNLKLMQLTGYADAECNIPVGEPYLMMINPDSLNRDRNADGADDLSFNIVIDCTGVVDPNRTDMGIEITALEKVVYTYNGDIHAPNFVKIEWGGHLTFKGRLTSLNINYTLFRPDGSPLRAKIALAFTSNMPKLPVNSPQLNAETLEQLYTVLSTASITGITVKQLQLILFKRLNQEAGTGKITADNIWAQLAWDICIKQGATKKAFTAGIEKVKNLLPPPLQTAWTNFNTQPEGPFVIADKKPILKPVPQKPAVTKNTGIAIRNAGLVLLNNFIPTLFERLDLTANGQFINIEAQHQAVHYLQYLVTGLTNTEEMYLPLNKTMCGLPLSQPVPGGIEITTEETKLMDGLIQAVIGYWASIGSSSIDGFKGNWLIRDGLLKEQDDRWELTVEKRAYDILLQKSPFSFSIIKYPWMDKPLYVNWPC